MTMSMSLALQQAYAFLLQTFKTGCRVSGRRLGRSWIGTEVVVGGLAQVRANGTDIANAGVLNRTMAMRGIASDCIVGGGMVSGRMGHKGRPISDRSPLQAKRRQRPLALRLISANLHGFLNAGRRLGFFALWQPLAQDRPSQMGGDDTGKVADFHHRDERDSKDGRLAYRGATEHRRDGHGDNEESSKNGEGPNLDGGSGNHAYQAYKQNTVRHRLTTYSLYALTKLLPRHIAPDFGRSAFICQNITRNKQHILVNIQMPERHKY